MNYTDAIPTSTRTARRVRRGKQCASEVDCVAGLAHVGAAEDEDLAVPWSSSSRERSSPDGMLTAPGTSSTAARTARARQQEPPFAASQWLSGMSPRRTSGATIPAKLIGSFALPNGGE